MVSSDVTALVGEPERLPAAPLTAGKGSRVAISATLSLFGAFAFTPGEHKSASTLGALKYTYSFGPAPFL